MPEYPLKKTLLALCLSVLSLGSFETFFEEDSSLPSSLPFLLNQWFEEDGSASEIQTMLDAITSPTDQSLWTASLLSHYLTSDLWETQGSTSPQWQLLSRYIASGNLKMSQDNVGQMLEKQLWEQFAEIKTQNPVILRQIRETMRQALLKNIPTLDEALESQFRLHLPIWGGLYHQFTTHHGINPPVYRDLFPSEVQQS